jgi:ketosteroid isomerase-like protein
MKNLRSYVMIAFAATEMIACNTAPKEQPVADTKANAVAFDMTKAKAFVDSVNAKFTEEVRNGDSVALASHYSTDAALLFEHSDPIKGKDILAAWGDFVRSGVKDFTFETTDITLDGGLLVETGAYTMKTADNTLIDKGKYLVVWKQENGVWKLFRDMGNTSMPAAK